MWVEIFIWILFGLVGYTMAENRGRNTTLGFVYGAFFGIFAIICYAIVGDSMEKRTDELVRKLNRKW